jgi:hypothetical protein
VFVDQLTEAVEGASTPVQFAMLERLIWHQAWANGQITDDDAQRLAEALQTRKGLRQVERADPKRSTRAEGRIKGPKKAAAIARRRYLASCWPAPPEMLAHFTMSEAAALRIVGDEIKIHGTSTLCHAAVAARAGTCVTVVKDMYRKGRALCLFTTEERRRRGQRSLTNIVRPRCKVWLKWVRRHELGRRQPNQGPLGAETTEIRPPRTTQKERGEAPAYARALLRLGVPPKEGEGAPPRGGASLPT